MGKAGSFDGINMIKVIGGALAEGEEWLGCEDVFPDFQMGLGEWEGGGVLMGLI